MSGLRRGPRMWRHEVFIHICHNQVFICWSPGLLKQETDPLPGESKLWWHVCRQPLEVTPSSTLIVNLHVSSYDIKATELPSLKFWALFLDEILVWVDIVICFFLIGFYACFMEFNRLEIHWPFYTIICFVWIRLPN